MQEFAVRFSIADALQILDDSPIRPDIVTQVTLVQISNRVPIAHLAIERGLKFLIQINGGEFEWRHDLHIHLRALRELDPSAVAFLEKAFDDTTEFYGLNPNRSDLGHVRSLDTYLSTVGTADAFERMRYLELNPEQDEPLFRKIWPTIHREILLAISQLYISNRSETETINGRVERTVHDALFPTEKLFYSPGSAHEASIKRYVDWILNHTSRQAALTDAFRQDFAIGDEFMNAIVSQAYQALAQSQDPAIKYLTSRINVLPRQPRDVIPPVEWLGPQKEKHGTVLTPGGTTLGFVEKTPDGIWHITPLREGAVGISDRAQSQTDARSYLAQLLTDSCTVTVNGELRTIRLVGSSPHRFTRNYRRMSESADPADPVPWTHKLTCWDQNHGIKPDDQIRAELPNTDGHPIVHVIEGHVTVAEDSDLYIEGSYYLDMPNTSKSLEAQQLQSVQSAVAFQPPYTTGPAHLAGPVVTNYKPTSTHKMEGK